MRWDWVGTDIKQKCRILSKVKGQTSSHRVKLEEEVDKKREKKKNKGRKEGRKGGKMQMKQTGLNFFRSFNFSQRKSHNVSFIAIFLYVLTSIGHSHTLGKVDKNFKVM